MIHHIIFAVARSIQYFISKVLGNKLNYLNVPDEIINSRDVDNILNFIHILPSILISVICIVKILPVISPLYKVSIDDNGILIPLSFFPFFIFVFFLNGILIEKWLMKRNSKYKIFVK